MEFNIEIRKRQLKSLKQYIQSSEDNVQAVLHSLGWNSKKTLEKEDPKVICPINKNHLISYKTSENHLEKCTLHCSGYDSNDKYLSEPPEASKYSIKLNTAKKVEVISAAKSNKSEFKSAWNGRDSDPMTANRLMSTFSMDERSAIYDYCLKHTEAPPKPKEFTLELPEPKEKHQLSEKEKLSLERDAKRRRIKHKSVHTSKKSHTEITKEVIDNQMALYTQWIEQKQEHERKEREKLERLKNEKNIQNRAKDQLNEGEQNAIYHYIETTYSQSNVNQGNHNAAQWDQSIQYPGNYGSQYYGSSQVTQGIITDWSHVYQGGIDTDIYADSGQYQLESSEYTENAKTPVNSTSVAYTENSTLNSKVLPLAYNGYSQQNNSIEEPLTKIKKKDHLELKVRFKEPPYENRIRHRSRSREKDKRHEKGTRRHRSRERRKERRY